MRFVVCTHSYLLLVTVEQNPKLDMGDVTDFIVTDVKELDTGYFDGADVTKDGTMIVAARKTSPWSANSSCMFRWYNEHGRMNLPEMDGSDVLDPHQVTLGWHDRLLWCVSTADNSIVVKAIRDIDMAHKMYFNLGSRIDDLNHINSIFVPTSKSDIYTLWHNHGDYPSQIHKHEFFITGSLAISDRQDLPHTGAHNVIVEDDTFYYNASEDGLIVRGVWDKDTYDMAEVGEGWHPKGMCATDDYIVSGYSEHAVETPRRYISKSGLAFVDRRSWEVVAMPTILLDGQCVGNINEVRLFS